MQSTHKIILFLSLALAGITSCDLRAMHNQPHQPYLIIDIPDDHDVDNRDHAPRQNICTRLSNRATILVIGIKNSAGTFKNKVGSLLSAAGQRIMRLPGAQTAAQAAHDYTKIILANKEELLGSVLIVLCVTGGLYELTADPHVYYLALPIFNTLLSFCENLELLRSWKKCVVQLAGLSLPSNLWVTVPIILLDGFIDMGSVIIGNYEDELCFVMLTFYTGIPTHFLIFKGNPHIPDSVTAFFACYYNFPLLLLLVNKIKNRTNAQRTLLLDAIGLPIEKNAKKIFDNRQNARPAFALMLLDLGADVNPNTPVTPLQRAVQTNQLEIVKSLIAHGAQIEAKTPNYPHTPLAMAVGRNHVSLAAELLRQGANQRPQTNNGQSYKKLLATARKYGREEIASLLRNTRYEEYQQDKHLSCIIDHLKIRDIVLLVIDYE